ncbi:isochorismatase family protein [Vibrio sinaloensis]|uniref:isochorismatase family protein n=1 Tax=Photobacterium sp. (strain ATCC 43367) TaxID=379097 RepID=UPI0020525E69|nr:isochorismatase family protein [Vibrio sinaloensis]UPQ86923.1 isochorismatase family protein [Vibrio sinaloensis]
MLKRSKTGLVIVDVQGKLARLVEDSEQVIANCANLIQGAKHLSLPIVWLEQNPDKLGNTDQRLTQHLDGYSPIKKFAFNAGAEPEFVQTVKSIEVETWLVCGVEAHICVYQTALGLRELGYRVEVVQDCVSSRSLHHKQWALDKLAQLGVLSTCVEMALYELVEDCRDPAFKPILRLIK